MTDPTFGALLEQLSAKSDHDPAAALDLWPQIVEHPDWPGLDARRRLAALDDVAAARSAVGDHGGAVAAAADALARTAPTDDDIPYRLGQLAAAVRARFTANRRPGDLDRLLELRRTAVAATRPDAPELVVRLSALADAYRLAAQSRADGMALDGAVEAAEQAVQAAGRLGIDSARSHGNLAVALSDRFDAGGRREDLDAAITAANAAVEASPPGHRDRGTHLSLRATLLSDRYDHFGALDDLRLAATTARAAHDEPFDDMHELARLQNLLGVLELDRYERDNDSDALGSALRWAAAAVATAGETDPELSGYLTNLGNADRLAFETTVAATDWSGSDDVTLDIADLRAAIAAHREAVARSPAGSADHPNRLTNLGSLLTDAALVLPDEIDLDEAVEVLDEAVTATSPGSPHRAGRLNNLATALRLRGDDDRARATLRRACAPGGRPESILAAASNWTAWAVERGAWSEVVEATGHAVTAGDTLYRTQLTRSDRSSWLRAADGLALDRADALARIGDTPGSAEAVERGRARMLSDVLDRDRAALNRLAGRRPDLVARYNAASDAWRIAERDGR